MGPSGFCVGNYRDFPPVGFTSIASGGIVRSVDVWYEEEKIISPGHQGHGTFMLPIHNLVFTSWYG